MSIILPINRKRKPSVGKTFDYLVEYLRDIILDRVSRDITTNTIMVTKKLPWDDEEIDIELNDYYSEDANIYVRVFKDSDLLMIKKTLSGKKKLEFTSNEIRHAVEYLANLNTINPIENYLNSLKWDEKPRLENWLLEYCEAYGPSVDIIKKVSQRFLIGMVRRGLNPGAKMDYMLILQGKQGIGKSTLCKLLAGKSQFYSEEIPRFSDSRTIIETYGGKLVVEVGEMANFATTNQVELLKQFITKDSDQARPAYAQFAITMPRTFVLIGTTNNKTFITDSTGWRRYWPVCIKSVDVEGIRGIREQLLAEATHYARHETYTTFLNEEEEKEYDLFRTSRIKLGSETVIDSIRSNFENLKELATTFSTNNGDKIGVTIKVVKNVITEQFLDAKISSQEVGKALTSLGFKRYKTLVERYWIVPEELPEEDEDFDS